MLALPASALASVEITEILYDLPGADAGREWVEVTNTGGSAVDLSGYKFFQGGVNHGLSVTSGSSVLGVQQSAVIVADQSKFNADNPQFSGTLLKSSFSLSNTGETITLKDSALTAVDSVSYASSAGAAGDGNSLHRVLTQSGSGGTFVANQPTPGVFSENPGSTNVAPAEQAATTTNTQPQTQQSPASPLPPSMDADAGGSRTVEAGAGSFFEGNVYNSAGVPMQHGRYIWNFGNGETREGQAIFYAYPYPGTYVVIMTVDTGNGYSVMDRITVEAVPAEVSLSEQDDGSLTVANVTHADNDLDLSLWALARGGSVFTIPKGTIVLAGRAVRFAPGLLKLPPGDAALLYPNGIVAARTNAAVGDSHAAGIEYLNAADPIPQNITVPPPRENTPAPATQNPSSEKAALNLQDQTAAVAQSAGDFPIGLPVVGLGALVVLGAAGALFAGRRPAGDEVKSDDSNTEADEQAAQFTIRELRASDGSSDL